MGYTCLQKRVSLPSKTLIKTLKYPPFILSLHYYTSFRLLHLPFPTSPDIPPLHFLYSFPYFSFLYFSSPHFPYYPFLHSPHFQSTPILIYTSPSLHFPYFLSTISPTPNLTFPHLPSIPLPGTKYDGLTDGHLTETIMFSAWGYGILKINRYQFVIWVISHL